jgi:hypothetical protein
MARIRDGILGCKPHALYVYLSLFDLPPITPTLAVVGVRAFTMSQSAEAHVILFQRIFNFATEDSKIPIHFYLNGSGIISE